MKIISVEQDEGFAKDPRPFAMGELVLLSLPCPGRTMRRGVGGQMMTSCTFCGEVMPSTAGPHSPDGRWYKPVLTYESDGSVGVSWTPYNPVLHMLSEPGDVPR